MAGGLDAVVGDDRSDFVRLFDGSPASDWWIILDLDAGLRIDGEGELEVADEGRLELAQALEAGAELLMQPRPADRGRTPRA